MKRRLFALAAAVSLLMCLATAARAVQGYCSRETELFRCYDVILQGFKS